MADLSAEIKAAAQAPKSVTHDGTTATAQELDAMVRADAHLANRAAARSPFACIRRRKIVPPGAI